MVAALSLRERKKLKTRRTLVEIAHRRFAKQGYDQTTLEEICDEAEVSIRTLLRYFRSKEELALAGYREALEDLREAFAARGPEKSTLAVWREQVRANAARITNSKEHVRFRRFVESVPVLKAALAGIMSEYEQLLAEEFAREAGRKPAEDLEGHLVAATLVAGHSAAVRHWIRHRDGSDLTRTVLQVIDFIEEHFPRQRRSTRRPRSGRGTRGSTRPAQGARRSRSRP